MKTTRDEQINFLQIQRFITSATTKLKKAKAVLTIDEQTGFQMAYDAMLRASLALMLSFGKRPRSTMGHHKIIIDFVSSKLDSQYQNLLKTFDRMRRKRNEAIYEPMSTITEKETKDAITIGENYLKIITNEIKTKNPQQTLFH